MIDQGYPDWLDPYGILGTGGKTAANQHENDKDFFLLSRHPARKYVEGG